jgi:hypothetical protein
VTSLRSPWSILAAGSVAIAAPAPAQTVAEVQVTPETLTLTVGGRQTLFATAYDRQGKLIPNARFTFWSSDTLVATVARNGAVVAVGPGLAKVEARIRGLQASTAVLVTAPGGPADTAGAAVLTLEPASAALLPGEGLVLQARALREDGTPAAAGKVGWRSLDPRVAAVDSGGVVIAAAPGRTIIRASVRGLVATAAVEVAAGQVALSTDSLIFGPGEVDTLRAVVPGQGNREVRGGVRWQSSDTAVVRVGPTGIVSAVAPGRAEVVAYWFGQERRAAVLVHPEPRTLVVTPRPGSGPIQLPVRAVRRVAVTAEAADSTPIPGARILWEIGDTAVIAYDAAKGELTGRGIGSTTLTARLHGFDPVSWDVQVIPGNLALDRTRLGIGVGERDSIRAVLLDQAGQPIGVPTELEWTSSAPEVLQVSPGGIIDGIRPGRSVVTVSAPWGKRVTADVFVVADLFLASNRRGTVGIYQIRSTVADTLRPVLADSFANIQPALSPDRTRIAFSSNRQGSYDLFLMDADGTGLRRLTTDPGTEGEPVWTPDGSRLIYTARPKGGSPQRSPPRPAAITRRRSPPTVEPWPSSRPAKATRRSISCRWRAARLAESPGPTSGSRTPTSCQTATCSSQSSGGAARRALGSPASRYPRASWRRCSRPSSPSPASRCHATADGWPTSWDDSPTPAEGGRSSTCSSGRSPTAGLPPRWRSIPASTC